MRTEPTGAAGATRIWPVRRAPARLLVYLFAVEALAAGWSGVALVRHPGDGAGWGLAGLLFVLALVFDEVAGRAARLRIKLSARLRTDMTSVWAIAACVALPRGVAVVLLLAVLGYDWFRHQRPAGEPLYRKIFIAASVLCAALVAAPVHDAVAGSLSRPGTLTAALAVFAAIVVYGVVQRGLVTLAVVTLGDRGRVLLGSKDDNLIELATLCLGGLVALALMYEPWLAILALAPMITLHRGALVRDLETAATIDSKTGLFNAVAWEELAQRELARAKREGKQLAVLILDVDHFKLINDRHGHLVGDLVLRGLGRSLSALVREYDTVGRFGGEEFVAILPDVDAAAALEIAERVRARIGEATLATLASEVAGPPERVAVSIGVARLHLHGAELSDLLYAADRALYRAKALGRDRVELADSDPEIPAGFAGA